MPRMGFPGRKDTIIQCVFSWWQAGEIPCVKRRAGMEGLNIDPQESFLTQLEILVGFSPSISLK